MDMGISSPSSQVTFIHMALNHKQSERASHAHSKQILTTSPDLNPQEVMEKKNFIQLSQHPISKIST